MGKKPKIIIIKDKEQNIKSIQEYDYNRHGDPILFKKFNNMDEILIHWIYEYKYDEFKRKIMMKIFDIGEGKETIMEYKY